MTPGWRAPSGAAFGSVPEPPPEETLGNERARKHTVSQFAATHVVQDTRECMYLHDGIASTFSLKFVVRSVSVVVVRCQTTAFGTSLCAVFRGSAATRSADTVNIARVTEIALLPSDVIDNPYSGKPSRSWRRVPGRIGRIEQGTINCQSPRRFSPSSWLYWPPWFWKSIFWWVARKISESWTKRTSDTWGNDRRWR